jgi:hypothetical protein
MGHMYLDMLEDFLVPQLEVNNVISQQDGPFPTTTEMWCGT